jgi:LPS export ABC transporter protein LptC
MSIRCFPLSILLFMLVLSGCSQRGGQGADRGKAEPEAVPAYSLEDVTHYQYDDGVLRLKVNFDRGAYYDDRQELRIENCMFVYYDSDGNEVSTGRSRRATIHRESSQLIAEEDVVIVSEVNRGRLETDYLEWRGDESQFVTESYVTITRDNGDTLQGVGMITDMALNYVTIKRDVRGSFEAQ